jgi:DNA-binding MarR family transcriptional regulator
MDYEGFLPQGSHLGILADLVIKDGPRQQDLALSAIIDKATVARALGNLQREGMIRRSVDLEDRRQKRIYITDRGRDLWRHARDYSQQTIAIARRGVSDEELLTCTRVLQRMYHNLNEQLTQPQNISNEQ